MPRWKALSAGDMRTLALKLPETTEGQHMGHPDFRVRNKIFASLSENGLRAAAKIDPVNLDALVAADPATFRDAWGGRWVGIDLARVPRPMLRDLLLDAWCLVAPRELVQALPRSKR